MITINYCKEGQAYSDYNAEKILANWLTEETDHTYKVSTENIVSYVRLYIAEGKTDITKVQLQFNGEPLEMNEYAVINNWIKGFCDYNNDNAVRIIRAQNAKRRLNRINSREV